MALYRVIIAGFVIFVTITMLVVLLTGMFSMTNTLMRSPMSPLIWKQCNNTDLIVSKVELTDVIL